MAGRLPRVRRRRRRWRRGAGATSVAGGGGSVDAPARRGASFGRKKGEHARTHGGRAAAGPRAPSPTGRRGGGGGEPRPGTPGPTDRKVPTHDAEAAGATPAPGPRQGPTPHALLPDAHAPGGTTHGAGRDPKTELPLILRHPTSTPPSPHFTPERYKRTRPLPPLTPPSLPPRDQNSGSYRPSPPTPLHPCGEPRKSVLSIVPDTPRPLLLRHPAEGTKRVVPTAPSTSPLYPLDGTKRVAPTAPTAAPHLHSPGRSQKN